MLKQGIVERHFSLEQKVSAPYLLYLQTLHDYLISYFTRVQPLINIVTELRGEEADFETSWDAGQVKDWTPPSKGGASTSASASATGVEQPIWCPYCELHWVSFSPVLMTTGQIHLAKRSVYESHIKSKKHLKNQAANADADAASDAPQASSSSVQIRRNKYYAPARLTHLIAYLLKRDPLPTVLSDSKESILRREALTAEEREQEMQDMMNEEEPMDVELQVQEEDQPDDESDDDYDGKVYNPLKLPLGWDGKPIPYWLYKLHGLGKEYKCQICSDFGYMGR